MRAIELIAESNIMDISLHDVPYILPHKKEALSTAGLVVHHNSRQVAYYDLFQRLGGVSSIDIYIRYMPETHRRRLKPEVVLSPKWLMTGM